MYNEELEQLIDAALTDGELTEKEKQILFKKAQAMGVDLDEIEMVLEARLIKKKSENNQLPQNIIARKVQPRTAVMSSKKLTDIINEIEDDGISEDECEDEEDYKELETQQVGCSKNDSKNRRPKTMF